MKFQICLSNFSSSSFLFFPFVWIVFQLFFSFFRLTVSLSLVVFALFSCVPFISSRIDFGLWKAPCTHLMRRDRCLLAVGPRFQDVFWFHGKSLRNFKFDWRCSCLSHRRRISPFVPRKLAHLLCAHSTLIEFLRNSSWDTRAQRQADT